MAELNLKQIIDRLNAEFTGETRKLVFWYDDKAEFAEDMETVELQNAKIYYLQPDNQFYTKYFLERVDKTTDPDKRIYCSCCWDTKKMLVQGQKMSLGQYKCPSCGITAFYDKKAYDERLSAAIKNMGRKTISHGI